MNLPVNYQPSFAFSSGSGALQGDQVYQATLALTAGAASVDLSGVLTDAFRRRHDFSPRESTRLQEQLGKQHHDIGRRSECPVDHAPGYNDIHVIVRPGGVFQVIAPDATGYAITATTGDILKVAGTGTETFDLLMLLAST